MHADGTTPTHGIDIVAAGGAGALYAAQSLLQMTRHGDGFIPSVRIVDSPRFEYRGFMLDVARNFRSKEDVLVVLELMSR